MQTLSWQLSECGLWVVSTATIIQTGKQAAVEPDHLCTVVVFQSGSHVTPLGTVGVASHWTKVAGGGLIKIGSRAPKASIESPLCGRPSDRDDAANSIRNCSRALMPTPPFRSLFAFSALAISLAIAAPVGPALQRRGTSTTAATSARSCPTPATSVTAPMSKDARPGCGWIRRKGPMPNSNRARRPSSRSSTKSAMYQRLTSHDPGRQNAAAGLGQNNFARADRTHQTGSTRGPSSMPTGHLCLRNRPAPAIKESGRGPKSDRPIYHGPAGRGGAASLTGSGQDDTHSPRDSRSDRPAADDRRGRRLFGRPFADATKNSSTGCSRLRNTASR